jgi:hypothetical protein
MSNGLRVGAEAVHVERLLAGGRPREIRRARIVRETKTQWIDDLGTRWRKSDGAKVPQYVSDRFLISVESFEAELARRE